MTRQSMSRPRSGAGQGVSTEEPRRSLRVRQAANRSRGAPPPPPAPPLQRSNTGGRRVKRSREEEAWAGNCQVKRRRQAAARKRYKQKEEGSVDDSEAEFASTELFNLTAEEVLPYWRLYKKRANMALLFYHENNQDDHYEFTTLRLNDVYDFMDGRVSYLHMNFKAKNETSGSEKLFFAELALEGDACDKRNGGYNTITCSIVDDKCAGGQKEMLYVKDDLSPDGYDQHNCYVCAEKIKHSVGTSYKGGHCTRDYWVPDSSVE